MHNLVPGVLNNPFSPANPSPPQERPWPSWCPAGNPACLFPGFPGLRLTPKPDVTHLFSPWDPSPHCAAWTVSHRRRGHGGWRHIRSQRDALDVICLDVMSVQLLWGVPQAWALQAVRSDPTRNGVLSHAWCTDLWCFRRASSFVDAVPHGSCAIPMVSFQSISHNCLTDRIALTCPTKVCCRART